MKNKDIDQALEAICHPEHIADDLASFLEEQNIELTESQADAFINFVWTYMKVVAENWKD